MSVLIEVYVLLIIVLSLLKPRIGIALYLSYLILVPFLNISISGVVFQYNIVNLLIFFITIYYIVQVKNSEIKVKQLSPFILLYVSLFCLIPFQNGVPENLQFDAWRVDIMKCLILSFAMFNIIRYDNSSYRIFTNILVISISIATIYGLVLTDLKGFNPYLTSILPLSGQEFNEGYATEDTGRIFGRISSVFNHPMTFGLFLCLSLIYVISIKIYLNKYVFYSLFVIILLDILFCGVRSAIGGAVAGITYYLIKKKNFKLLVTACLGVCLLWLVVQTIPGLDKYVSSITDVNNTEGTLNGSSIELRMRQLSGCFTEIKDNPLVGKGYGWTGYYHKTKGDHPIIFAFESLIFVIMCNSGFLGIIIWCMFLAKIFKQTRKTTPSNKHQIILAQSLIITYVTYSCITGEYGYMQYFIIFYTLMYIQIINVQPTKASKIEINEKVKS